MVATDNASYSDIVFGTFKILGYNFSPRFKDLDDQRFWRARMPGVETGTYGLLEPLARNRVNLKKIEMWWPDMLRFAGSLVTNQIRAYDLLRMFGREGNPTPLDCLDVLGVEPLIAQLHEAGRPRCAETGFSRDARQRGNESILIRLSARSAGDAAVNAYTSPRRPKRSGG